MGGDAAGRSQDEGWRAEVTVQVGDGAVPAARHTGPAEARVRLPDRPLVSRRAQGNGLRRPAVAERAAARFVSARLCSPAARRALRGAVRSPEPVMGAAD